MWYYCLLKKFYHVIVDRKCFLVCIYVSNILFLAFLFSFFLRNMNQIQTVRYQRSFPINFLCKYKVNIKKKGIEKSI